MRIFSFLLLVSALTFCTKSYAFPDNAPEKANFMKKHTTPKGRKVLKKPDFCIKVPGPGDSKSQLIPISKSEIEQMRRDIAYLKALRRFDFFMDVVHVLGIFIFALCLFFLWRRQKKVNDAFNAF